MNDEPERARRFRVSWLTRLLIPAALIAILLLEPTLLRFALPAISPLFCVCSAVASRAMTAATALGIPLVTICLLRRRWLCRWLCPVGPACGACSRLRRKKPTLKKLPHLGQWLALLTLGASIAAVPILLVFDPMVFISCGFCMVLLPAAIVVSIFLPGAWCAKICPLGGAQDLLFDAVHRRGTESKPAPGKFAMARRVFLGAGVGAGAGLVLGRFISLAPLRLRPPGSASEGRFKSLCIRCGNCARSCPVKIIHPDADPPDTAGVLAPMISFESERAHFPPENYCRQDCNRCGQCCPVGAIEALPLEEKNRRKIGLARVDLSACHLKFGMECHICSLVCPHKAISEEGDYDVNIIIDSRICNGCGMCEVICPAQAILIEPYNPDNGSENP
jgi:ferredoxin